MASGRKGLGLGGGLSNLFGDNAVADLNAETSADSISKIAVSRIEPNPNQPRKIFAQEALDELAESIRLHGVITPITVRAGKKDGTYQIIAGERRWRAARQAGLDEIPAMVIEASESEVMELALIENLQRQDLNPIEEAEGYEQLMRDYGLTQEQVAQRVVKSRPAVANALRLLQLPEEVRTMVSRGELSGGHARAVLAVAEEDKRTDAAKQMVGMTVGEEKDLNVTFPEKYHAENLAGKNAVFHVKVNSITKTELPELDDDFAQDNGFDTFDAYKADVAKKLQEIADTNYDVEIENALIEKAVANAQMDIPAAMIDDQLNYVMRDVEYSMMRQGLRMEDYLKYTGQTREQMAQQYRGEAENRVKIQLVLEAIRKAENIEPTAEDIDEQSAKQAKRAGQEVEAFKANLTDEHKAYLSDLAAIQKVCDLMKAGATVVDKKPEEAAETAEETKTEE